MCVEATAAVPGVYVENLHLAVYAQCLNNAKGNKQDIRHRYELTTKLYFLNIYAMSRYRDLFWPTMCDMKYTDDAHP